MKRDVLAASLIASLLLAGCTGADDEPMDEPDGDDFSRSCTVKLFAQDMVPSGAYVLPLNRTAWKENATLLDDALEQALAANVSRPYDFGGECNDGYEDEVEWMISQYGTDPDARTTERRPGEHAFYFSLERAGETLYLQVGASYYGYDRYPT